MARILPITDVSLALSFDDGRFWAFASGVADQKSGQAMQTTNMCGGSVLERRAFTTEKGLAIARTGGLYILREEPHFAAGEGWSYAYGVIISETELGPAWGH